MRIFNYTVQTLQSGYDRGFVVGKDFSEAARFLEKYYDKELISIEKLYYIDSFNLPVYSFADNGKGELLKDLNDD